MRIATVDYTAPHAAEEFARSVHATGFGILRGHPLAESGLPEVVRQEWSRFFETDRKWKYRTSGGQDGFFPSPPVRGGPGAQELGQREFFQVLRHGTYPEEVSDSALRYFDEGRRLAATILGWLGDSAPAEVPQGFGMPLPRTLAAGSGTTLRIQRYFPRIDENTNASLRGFAHKDLSLVTVLAAPREPGLQVRDNAGEWHDVPCDPGAFVINTGEMLEQITAGHYRATEHRVRWPGGGGSGRSRLSMPLFVHPAGNTRLNEHHTAASFLNERLAEMHREWMSAGRRADRRAPAR
ncbi:2OG-Fe(II) oxygenase family protein [Streptomyces sp. NPDC127098]|uniref:2OG-Fe(II) oxygenase family protein n=1 Tax=Streptomyces sp. NPDC127098 TaxID=3347137 RepID=UPI00365CCC15